MNKYKEYSRLYYLKNKNKLNVYSKKWKQENPNKVAVHKKNASSKYIHKQKVSKESWHKRNKEYLKLKTKMWHLNNKDKSFKYQKQYRMANPNKHRDNILKTKYGITTDQYNDMFNRQKGDCAICGRHQSEFKRSLNVDHNHSTHTVRGLLCSNCNLIIGHAKDNIDILHKAILYLKGEIK